MKFFILPLLAAVNYLDHNDPAWQSGPEIIYNISHTADIIHSADVKLFPSIMVKNVTSQLKCRYQVPDYLNCKLERSKIWYSFAKYGRLTEDAWTEFFFGIKFNKFGIENLVVPTSVSGQGLDKIRFIANQFHAGIDLVGKTDGTYKLYENTTIGSCLTEYNIQLNELMKHYTKEKTGKYKMWTPAMGVVIDKKRHTNNCKITAPYFFGSIENWSEEPEFSIKVKSSTSHIVASHSSFYSKTESTVDLLPLENPVESNLIQIREKIIIVYDSVVMAKDKYPEIVDPKSVGMITGKSNNNEEINSDDLENNSNN